ncbi:MAG: NUDIX hydrolase [Thermogutta sp.]|uniref:NUDIX domain-containing protein n=1 Tax=Thermogutta sp. TaxID=1962930 RepID=UPI0019CB284F|nr:NUDIX domain-containing protein [Thermogutta sp.]MBC7352650.1 NUDIX hydrolase [Thermogutta sp.]
MGYTYEYPRPAVCVDCVIFGLPETEADHPHSSPEVLLIQRARPPFAGMWALPGGFVDIDEPLETAAARELEEETGIRGAALEVAGVYGTPGRDPRGRTISIVYRAVVWKSAHSPQGGDDAAKAEWFSLSALPPMAFDHNQIVEEVTENLRRDIRTRPFGRELFPDSFAIVDLQRVYEIMLGCSVSARKLQSFLLKMGVIALAEGAEAASPPMQTAGRQRKLFRFCPTVYEELARTGFSPEVFAGT